MIPLMKSAFLNEAETLKALSEFLLTGPRLSMDVQCGQFEKEFAEFHGVKEALLFNSGGSANLAMIQTLKNLGEIKEGDAVGFSSLTWSTNVMPLIQMGLEPVPIDCDELTLNVMSPSIEKAIDEYNLKMVFLTNVLGFTGDLPTIRKICEDRNVLLIEDNCEALGSEVEGQKAGTFGRMSSFSFFIAHHMSSIEGGMVCTNDEDMAEMLRIVRANGWDRNLTSRQQHKWRKKHGINSEFEAKYSFYDLGFNMRPTEITGFLGKYQMQFLNYAIECREKNYLRFERTIKQNDDLIMPERQHLTKLSNFSVPVICQSLELKEHYISQFSGAGIEVRPLIAGNITKQPFFKKYCKKKYALPAADKLHDCGFYFGNYPELTDSDMETIDSCLCQY